MWSSQTIVLTRLWALTVGLGDVAVPGLLACLALRYDASRVIDLRPRASAAARAFHSALDAVNASASDQQVLEMSSLLYVVG